MEKSEKRTDTRTSDMASRRWRSVLYITAFESMRESNCILRLLEQQSPFRTQTSRYLDFNIRRLLFNVFAYRFCCVLVSGRTGYYGRLATKGRFGNFGPIYL